MNGEAGFAIGVDIGGTKTAFVLMDSLGNAWRRSEIPTQPKDGVSTVLDRITEVIRQMMSDSAQPISGIGIGSPGVIDPKSGVVHYAVNLDWKEVSLRDAIARRLQTQLPIYIQRDTNASTIGEYLYGAGKGTQNFVHIAIGTGLGMGAVVDGQLLMGRQALAMEMGHLGLYPEGRLCACGIRGCPEMYLSGNGLMASLREYKGDFPQSPLAQKEEATTGDIVQAAGANDPLALKIIETAAEALGAVMSMCAVALNPELFVIGGGLGQALYGRIVAPASEKVKARTLSPVHRNLRYAPSQITASAIGAASLVWYNRT
jgi:glucokinase